MTQLVLSLFPGIGLLDMAFEEAGFCVVRGPDLLWGGDIRKFHPPSGKFDGVIGGPPCQAFSQLVHIVRANGHEPHFGNLIPEFERVVSEAAPAWFLMENVPAAPAPVIEGYEIQDELLNNRWFGAEQERKRRFSFGSNDGRRLRIEQVALEPAEWSRAVTRDARTIPVKVGGSGKRKFSKTSHLNRGGGILPNTGATLKLAEMSRLQGLPEEFLDDSPFTLSAKRGMVGNGVPLPMGRAVAKAVMMAICPPSTTCPTLTPTTSTISKT